MTNNGQDADLAIQRAAAQLNHGNAEGAIETLIRVLGEHPDNAEAHAFLAISLVHRKRIHAARLEANRSLELAPELFAGHIAAAKAAMANRDFRIANHHLELAALLDPDSAWVELEKTQLALAQDDLGAASRHANHAIELDPGDDHAIAMLAHVLYRQGNIRSAREHATKALETDPENQQALVTLGFCDLAEGKPEEAREHAAWALQANPMDESAMALLCAVKARSSPALGLWWRFQAYVSAGSRSRTMVMLLGIYLMYRILLVAMDNHELGSWSVALQFLWVGFCVYTWVAPTFFYKSIRRELQQVKLRPGF